MSIFKNLNKSTTNKLKAVKVGSNKEQRIIKKHEQAKKVITDKFINS